MKLWLVTRREGRPAAPGALVWVLMALCALGNLSAGLTGLARAGSPTAEPVRLIMVEAPGCRFCAQWHAELGAAYANSAEAQFAPLLRVGRDAQVLKGLKTVTFTPTFIVLQGAVEAGRIAGYPGKDYFWAELQEILVPIGLPLAK